MPFDVNPQAGPDEMVVLGHMAARGVKPVTTKIKNKAPVPREARLAFVIGVGLFAGLLLVAVLRAHA